MSLNIKQKNAVSCRENCLVVACPGSGKSRVVVTKVVELLEQNPNEKIIVVTFSREGANELRERLTPLLSSELMEKVYVSTFHALALAHLKREGIQVKIAKNTNEYLMRAAQQATSETFPEEEAAKLLQKCKTTPGYKPGRDLAGRLYKEYQAICKSNNVVDFYDVMNMSLEKITTGSMPILNATQMLVDEFQDCDEIQYQYMMAHVRSGVKVTCVGDDDQAIYAFRNSLGYNGMVRFENESNAIRIVLDTNYRCKKEILSSAEELIKYNGSRMDKKLRAERGTGGCVTVTRHPDRKKEAEIVCADIVNHEFGVDLNTFLSNREKYPYEIEGKKYVVLARNNILLELIDATLKSFSIPTNKSFKSIWELSPITLMLSLMRAFDSSDRSNIEHLLYWAGIPHDDLVLLNSSIDNDYSKLFDRRSNKNIDLSFLNQSSQTKINSFISNLNGWAKGNSRSDTERTGVVISAISEWMLSNEKNKRVRNRIEIATSILLRAKGSMLERVSFVTKKNESKDNGGVHLMTMHASKGLEFDNVWIIAAETNIIPSDTGTPTKETLDEERRLMYVAMTRAKDNLYISSTGDNTPTLFLKEAKLA